METIEERQQNHERHMEEHFRMKMRVVGLKNIGFACHKIAHELNIPESTVRALIKEIDEDVKRLEENN